VELRHLCTGIQLTVATVLTALSVRNVLAVSETPRAAAAALRRAGPLAALVALTVLWPATLPGLQPLLLCLVVCFVYIRITCELVLCCMTQEAYPSWQPTLALLPAYYAAGFFGLLGGWPGTLSMGAYAALCAWDACQYILDVVEEAAAHLGVHVLRVTRRDD